MRSEDVSLFKYSNVSKIALNVANTVPSAEECDNQRVVSTLLNLLNCLFGYLYF